MILAGARAYFAMARDGVFFRRVGQLNAAHVPAWGLGWQGAWIVALILSRTYDSETGQYSNLYTSLLDYVVSAALLFYVLTVAGLFRLRRTRPQAPRPYRAFGYPWVPAVYMAGATFILVMLVVYRPATTWPGMGIVLLACRCTSPGVVAATAARGSRPEPSCQDVPPGFQKPVTDVMRPVGARAKTLVPRPRG